MTLRADLTALLADAAIADVDIEAALADEHVRSAAYRKVIAVVAAARGRGNDRAVVAAILRDPQDLTSKTAVIELIDAIALKTPDPAAFDQWAADLTPVIDHLMPPAHRPFAHHRIHDWKLYLTITTGHTPAPAALAAATPWMQRKLATESTSRPVLAALAESAATQKTRNIAGNRANSHAIRGEP
ncbi:MAG TPA: hypothetical protein VGL93_15535 [Streptosporangiaceae bacterium]|jgi:hypothetical protein